MLNLVLLTLSAAAPLNDTDSDSKVVIRNSIAYHFVKNVRSIEMDLFVTRKIDVKPMIKGIEKIKDVRDRVLTLCKRIPRLMQEQEAKVKAKSGAEATPVSAFHLVPLESSIPRTEAAALCKARNYQLPEVYTAQDNYDLTLLMKQNGISLVHAGIAWDLELNMHRFMATGLPAWNAWQRTLYHYLPSDQLLETDWIKVSGRGEARFFYMPDGSLGVYYEDNVLAEQYQFRRDYWSWAHNIKPFVAEALICQDRWNGSSVPSREAPKPWVFSKHTVPSHRVRQPESLPRGKRAATIKVNATQTGKADRINPLEELCLSVGGHLDETFARSQFRLTNLLALVDISIDKQFDDSDLVKRDVSNPLAFLTPSTYDTEKSNLTQSKDKRSLPTVIFKHGLKSIWTLIGFADKVRTRRRLGKLERTVEKQAQEISQLSKEITSHSISIAQLTTVTQDLNRRLDSLTTRVHELEAKMGALDTEVKTQQILQLIDSLIGRTEQALSFAFVRLESIIQCALVGQASAYLLPTGKLDEIQEEVNKQSPAIIDTAYERMKTVIVGDPLEVGSLLCVVNLAAMSRKTRELVNLVAVPWFQGTVAMAPSLDHHMVVLDQEAGYYTVVEPSEESGCMTDRCITSNPEVQISSPACGIPQLFDRQLAACVNEDILSNGMFLKQLISDGIIYSIRGHATAQIFCNQQNSKAKVITGSGAVNLPAGCSLVLTDQQGVTTRIQSSPISQVVETQSLDLIINGPTQIFHPSTGSQLNGTTSLTKILNAHLNELNQRLNDTSAEVEHQNKYVIVLGTLLGITTILCIITAALLYRYSRRFRRKVNNIAEDFRIGLNDAHKKFVTFEQMAVRRARDEPDVTPLLSRAAPPRMAQPPPPPGPDGAGYSPSLRSILKRLNDLELQIINADDVTEGTSASYLCPLDDDIVRGMTETYFGNERRQLAAMPPPVPPKPSSRAVRVGRDEFTAFQAASRDPQVPSTQIHPLTLLHHVKDESKPTS